MDTVSYLQVSAGAVCSALAVYLASVRLLPLWDAFAARKYAEPIARATRLGVEGSLIRSGLRLWAFLVIVVSLLFGWYWKMVPVAVAVGYLALRAPRQILEYVIAQRYAQLRDQMVGAAVSLANTTEAGLNLAEGLESVANETAKPLSGQLRRIVADFHRGRPLKDAVRAVQDQLKFAPFTLFASALLVSLDRGGRVNVSLRRISHSLQENQRLERRVLAETASGRRIAWILAAVPFFFLGVLQYFSPAETTLLYTTLIGQLVLAAAILIVNGGVRLAMRLVRLEA